MSPERNIMQISWEVLSGCLLALVGGLAWLFQLDGRVKVGENWRETHEKRHDELSDRMDYVVKRVDDIFDRLPDKNHDA